MSPKILVVGPDSKHTITPPPAVAEQARIATTRLDEAEGGVVIRAVNGVVRRLEAFEEITVTSEVLQLLEDCGYEIEHVAEEEPQV